MRNPSPSKRPTLDRDIIVKAAIDRVERHDIEELSARKLAQDLGCEAMSLYHHIGSMVALRDAMVDRLLASIPAASDKEPAEALTREAAAYLTLAKKYPRAFRLVATRRWKGERAAAFAARAIALFAALGFEPVEALTRARVLGAYLNGAGLAVAAWATDPDQPSRADVIRVTSDLDWGLKMLVESLTGPR